MAGLRSVLYDRRASDEVVKLLVKALDAQAVALKEQSKAMKVQAKALRAARLRPECQTSP
jgi:hypothetical protein